MERITVKEVEHIAFRLAQSPSNAKEEVIRYIQKFIKKHLVKLEK